MSILTCPVCSSQMREIEREGVAIDVCSQCRGVWLDRGELEKLAGVIASERASGVPRGIGRSRRDDDDDDDDDDDERGRRRRAEPFAREDDRSGRGVRPARTTGGWAESLFGGGDDRDDDDQRGGAHPQQRRRSSFLDFFD